MSGGRGGCKTNNQHEFIHSLSERFVLVQDINNQRLVVRMIWHSLHSDQSESVWSVLLSAIHLVPEWGWWTLTTPRPRANQRLVLCVSGLSEARLMLTPSHQTLALARPMRPGLVTWEYSGHSENSGQQPLTTRIRKTISISIIFT